jgi:hypothetical protein
MYLSYAKEDSVEYNIVQHFDYGNQIRIICTTSSPITFNVQNPDLWWFPSLFPVDYRVERVFSRALSQVVQQTKYL